MLDTLLLFVLLLVGSSSLLLLISIASALLKRRRHQALIHIPLSLLPAELSQLSTLPKVSILAFSTAACRQCRLLQSPVLQRVKDAHPAAVTIVEVQAAAAPELVAHFQVSTFPTTALFDEQGQLFTINYGFANAQCLLKQVEELLQSHPASLPV